MTVSGVLAHLLVDDGTCISQTKVPVFLHLNVSELQSGQWPSMYLTPWPWESKTSGWVGEIIFAWEETGVRRTICVWRRRPPRQRSPLRTYLSTAVTLFIPVSKGQKHLPVWEKHSSKRVHPPHKRCELDPGRDEEVGTGSQLVQFTSVHQSF